MARDFASCTRSLVGHSRLYPSLKLHYVPKASLTSAVEPQIYLIVLYYKLSSAVVLVVEKSTSWILSILKKKQKTSFLHDIICPKYYI